MSLVCPSEWKKEAEQGRLNLVSVFDVDGPCTIFTPYDADLETLPYRERRGMSVYWVVEKVDVSASEENAARREINQGEDSKTVEDRQRHGSLALDRFDDMILSVPTTYQMTSNGPKPPPLRDHKLLTPSPRNLLFGKHQQTDKRLMCGSSHSLWGGCNYLYRFDRLLSDLFQSIPVLYFTVRAVLRTNNSITSNQ